VTDAQKAAKPRSRRARIRPGTVGSAYVQSHLASIQGIATAMNITTNSGDGQRSHHRSCVEKLRESAPLVTVVSIRAVPSEAKHKLVLVVTVFHQGVADFWVPSQPISATTSNKR
jgi:hypothetical protein